MVSAALCCFAVVDLYSGIPAGVEKPTSDDFFGQSDYKNQESASHTGTGWPDGQGHRAKQACQKQTCSPLAEFYVISARGGYVYSNGC